LYIITEYQEMLDWQQLVELHSSEATELITTGKVILRINRTNAKSTQCIQPPQTFAASELVSRPAISCPSFSLPPTTVTKQQYKRA